MISIPKPTAALTYPGADGRQYLTREWFLFFNAVLLNVNNVSGFTVLQGDGAPTDGVTGADIAEPGTLYVDTSSPDYYMNGGTLASPVWKLVGRSA